MELDRMLKALGEPMRLKIFQALLERKHCVRSLSKKFGISESAISQHMKVRINDTRAKMLLHIFAIGFFIVNFYFALRNTNKNR